jgi:hypothetical protein
MLPPGAEDVGPEGPLGAAAIVWGTLLDVSLPDGEMDWISEWIATFWPPFNSARSN